MHCCERLAAAVEAAARRRDSWPPALMWSASWDEYRIVVADLDPARGSEQLNTQRASFCPFCGTGFRHSKRARWFAELHALGFDDPSEQDIPDEYNDARWWTAES